MSSLSNIPMNTAVQEEHLLQGSMVKLNDEYSIRVVNNLAEFATLREVWDTLAARHKEYFPFLCFDWFDIWLKHFLKDDKLFILLFYKDERLSTIAPFIIKNEKYKGLMNVKKIELIGNVHSFIRNFIFVASSYQEKKTFVKLILNFLINRFSDWDVLEFDSIPEEDEVFMILNDVMDEIGLKRRQYFCFGDWYLDGINYSGEDYLKNMNKNNIRPLKRRRKRLEEIGKLRLEIGEKETDFNNYLEIYYELRKKSWKNPERDKAFLEESRKKELGKGRLKFAFLFLDNSSIAVQVYIISQKIAYLIDTFYDQEYDRCSPGTILYSELIKYLIDVEHIKEIDQMRGDEPYKQSWTPQRRERKGITIFNKTLKGQALGFLMIKALPVVQSQPYLMTAKNKVLKYLSKGRE